MFPIYSSAIKYLCAKYTIFVLHRGEKTCDRDVVDPGHFTSESTQILIWEIMGCNLALENLKKNINDVIQKNKNIIDVLGRV
ncbi:hypothetical protein AB205_0152370 [Aquarana catesbeiana]|uniref:Uncharacterized protein n=1 Tax=Aquarana catesbeiana TaxID=8400 RepID=A0A2G9QA61_AQUCT|nr:hypothetical protein AB205_0152370 [Aquarana catesbeiana]